MQILEQTAEEFQLANLNITLVPWDRIYLYGDLWSGKTTLSKALIRRFFGDANMEITSPTYTYYKRYGDIWHFDLYRIESYDDFVNVGGEEIMEYANAIRIVEWPEKIEQAYPPTMRIYLEKDPTSDSARKIRIIRYDMEVTR